MTNHKIQFVGASCGQHGNYTFYKAFKYSLNGKPNILSLGEFFFVKFWEEEDIISIGEPQLIWEDKNSGQSLVSLRVYFLPENTPEGRCDEHGEDEVVSLSEKVILRADDVVSIMRAASGLKWKTGLKGIYDSASVEDEKYQDSPFYISPVARTLDIQEIIKEKSLLGDEVDSNKVRVIVLNYDSYCRIRALQKRLEGTDSEFMKSKVVRALGGFVVPSKNTHLVFCRDIFDYPELEGHELLCNHLAPKLQGRPRKKNVRTNSDSDSSETSEDQRRPPLKPKQTILTKSTTVIPGLTTKPNTATKFPLKVSSSSHGSSKMTSSSNSLTCQVKSEFSTPALDRLIEVDFMSKLYKFMKDRNTAITRLPYIGYKQLNVFELFTRVQQLGGYEVVSQKKLWKHLYEELAGKEPQSPSQNSGQNSGIGSIKKHYERLLLPYENFLLQEQRRILGIDSKKSNLKPQKLLSKQSKHAQNSHKTAHSSPSKCIEKNNFGIDKSKAHSLVKNETNEPSVSILQHTSSCEPESDSVVGASFPVADGGSTTITLVPPNEQRPSGERIFGTDSLVEPQNFGDRIQFALGTSNSEGPPIHVMPSSCSLASSILPDIGVPKVSTKKDSSNPSELSKRPEITITPIPRSFGTLLPGADSSLSSLQVADLMNLNLHSTLGVSALQDLAKIADRYDKATCGNLVDLGTHFSGMEQPAAKKRRSDDVLQNRRVNGTNHSNTADDSLKNAKRAKSPGGRPSYQPVPNLISADLLRQMSAIESNAKLLLPAHQSTKTINALTALLPQTTIFPSPAPAAHQQSTRTARKLQVDTSKPEPVFQSLSVYSQSKNIYGKPTAAHSSSDAPRRTNQDRRSSSPEIEILDLRIPNERKSAPTKNRKQSKSDSAVDIELLDLSARRDITVSAIPKPGSSKNTNSKIPPPQVSIVASDNARSPASGRVASNAPPLPGGAFGASSAASLMAAFASSQSIPSSLGNLGASNPSVLQYLMSSGLKTPSTPGVSSMFPYMDASTLASYYGLLSSGFLGPPNQVPTSSSTAVAAAAQQAAAAAQLAQLNSLGLAGLTNVSPEAVASLGIYKNYLPQGSAVPPHFLSSLLSPGGNQGPSTSSK